MDINNDLNYKNWLLLDLKTLEAAKDLKLRWRLTFQQDTNLKHTARTSAYTKSERIIELRWALSKS